MKACVELDLARRDGAMPVAVRLDLADAVTASEPLHRCEDCQLHLGAAIRAALACPLFGEPRTGVVIRCLHFVPRAG